jgi:hypothetical protein
MVEAWSLSHLQISTFVRDEGRERHDIKSILEHKQDLCQWSAITLPLDHEATLFWNIRNSVFRTNVLLPWKYTPK